MQDSTPLTTFVHADTSTFRELVQRLTGSSETENGSLSNLPQLNNAGSASEGAATKVIGVKKPTFKLHERRQYSKSKLEIVKPAGFQFKPAGSPILSPSSPGFYTPESGFSPTKVTNSTLIPSPSTKFSNLSIFEEEGKPTSSPNLDSKEEEKAIQERRFYLHPSPRSKTGSEPELLTLFPLTSPKSDHRT